MGAECDCTPLVVACFLLAHSVSCSMPVAFCCPLSASCCLPFVLCWPLPGGRIRMEVTSWSNGHHPCSRLHSQGGLGVIWTAAAAKPKSVLALGSTSHRTDESGKTQNVLAFFVPDTLVR